MVKRRHYLMGGKWKRGMVRFDRTPHIIPKRYKRKNHPTQLPSECVRWLICFLSGSDQLDMRRRRIYIPTSAHPPVSARANVPGSGAMLLPPNELVLCPKLNESIRRALLVLGVAITLIGDAELLM